jgi:hypothetical protein
MDIDDDDDNNNLLTVSRNCRPILEHKLVSYFLFSFQYKIISIDPRNTCCYSW